jgi:hypothetical protein
MQQAEEFRNVHDCAEFIARVLPIAERELKSFVLAVMLTWGADCSRQAIEDWIDKFESAAWDLSDPRLAIRQVTVAAIAQLAIRFEDGQLRPLTKSDRKPSSSTR